MCFLNDGKNVIKHFEEIFFILMLIIQKKSRSECLTVMKDYCPKGVLPEAKFSVRVRCPFYRLIRF